MKDDLAFYPGYYSDLFHSYSYVSVLKLITCFAVCCTLLPKLSVLLKIYIHCI
jgi:hypothetical protein